MILPTVRCPTTPPSALFSAQPGDTGPEPREVAGGCSEQNSRDSFQAAEDHGLGVEGGERDRAGRAGGRQGGHGCPGQLDLLG